MYKKTPFSLITLLFIYIISCTPISLPEQNKKKSLNITKEEQKNEQISESLISDEVINNTQKEIIENENTFTNKKLYPSITVLLSKDSNLKISKQFINVLELGVYDKKFDNVTLDIEYFDNAIDLEKIILKTQKEGKIYIGPIDDLSTKVAKNFCNNKIIFFSFASDNMLAQDCVYLINFFPNNELESLFNYFEDNSKIALLYPENEYGYLINSIIDEIVNKSNSILINRASYKNDLSNVRSSIKELGKYELRKYELERQKKILSLKNDKESIKRLKKLEKFKTTNDFDFTHVLIADYGINLLQVAPLLPYYDIDPNVIQFIGTGVIDDINFFYEPSLQGAIFPGIEKNERMDLIKKYSDFYDDNFMRISTLPYDLIGLLNLIFKKNMSLRELVNLLNDPSIRFDGIDGGFYFKNNMIERDLDILKISNGTASTVY